jgi:hypothetical protein
MKIIVDHDGVVIVESDTLLNTGDIIEFVERWKGGNWLMKVFEQNNPMLTDDGKYNYVLGVAK